MPYFHLLVRFSRTVWFSRTILLYDLDQNKISTNIHTFWTSSSVSTHMNTSITHQAAYIGGVAVLILILLVILVIKLKNCFKRRRWWVRSWKSKEREFFSFETLIFYEFQSEIEYLSLSPKFPLNRLIYRNYFCEIFTIVSDLFMRLEVRFIEG